MFHILVIDDGKHTRMLLRAMLENANYTVSAASVSIARNGTHTLVFISNHGKYIPRDNITHIFNKFYQADESHSSEGNGIGLAIVKKYANCITEA